MSLGRLSSLVEAARFLVAALLVGLVAGAASFVFIRGLEVVTDTREARPWVVLLLPLGGLLLGLVRLALDPAVTGGTDVVIQGAHSTDTPIPVAMAPYALLGTWMTHVLGGSAGREGTAVQLAGSLGDAVGRRLGLDPADRRDLVAVAIAAGFGSVFGVPLAGTIFAFEVGRRRPIRPRVLLAALVAAGTGDLVVRTAGYSHATHGMPAAPFSLRSVGALVVVGLACGAAGGGYVAATRLVRAAHERFVRARWMRPVVGGIVIVAAAAVVGPGYLGLSISLADAALAGVEVSAVAWLCKLWFTAMTIGSGFPGGEVVPLFVMGSTVAAVVAPVVGVDPAAAAVPGFIAAFAGAAGTPVAGAVMAGEVFGMSAVPSTFVICVIAAAVTARARLYHASGTPFGAVLSGRRRAG